MKNYKQKFLDGYHKRIDVSDKFINKNNLTLNRTQEEILEKTRQDSGTFFDNCNVLADYLEWKNAKEFYEDSFVEEVSKGNQKELKPITDVNEAVQDFLDYMVFGWKKAIDGRGLSASRTITYLHCWLWLFGRDGLAEMVRAKENYNPYGAPALIKLCRELGIAVPSDLSDFSKNKV